MNFFKKENLAAYRQDLLEKWEQEESRLRLYGIWKTLRDVGSTGDELLDYLITDFRKQALTIKERVMQINEEND